TQYHDWKAERKQGLQVAARQIEEAKTAAKLAPVSTSNRSNPSTKNAAKKGSKKGGKENRPRQTAEVEADISQAEKTLAELSEKMSQPDVARDAKRLRAANEAYQQAEVRLQELYAEWEQVSAVAS
ncbi:MAG: ABC transporter C-terminal domain-containing protein, partial [Pyrinomonadaceae bacterium]